MIKTSFAAAAMQDSRANVGSRIMALKLVVVSLPEPSANAAFDPFLRKTLPEYPESPGGTVSYALLVEESDESGDVIG